MKKLFLTTLILSLLLSMYSNAAIRRVGYTGPHVADVDYDDVNAAVQAAAAGDTIQLYQNSSIGGASVSKKLTFVGFGYDLELNPGLQVVPATPNGVTLYFLPSSEGSFVQGVRGNFWLGTDNITISRSTGNVYLGYNGQTGNTDIGSANINSSFVTIIGYYGKVSNALISNCIINNWQCGNVDGLVSNNIFTGYVTSFGGIVGKNNIFASGYCPQGTAAIFEKNLFAANCSVTGTGNQTSVDMNSVFVNWNNGNYGSETNLALKSGSPGKNFGTDNNGTVTDAGIFGGEKGLVYKPSGIPAIPSVYKLSAPTLSANSSPYTISVSVRSNN